ncbi:hypothetical protein BpHYR1_000904 [Brachionus plicatilis]|uniref:Uncharacterized protein n=1 Tax=Brachionus plicatilis TaxID=10195 RepID=A0A3M7SFI1_BRAPC|nr:hypothetical protein BpHYR1_000904 [Brachionus plicatilis]
MRSQMILGTTNDSREKNFYLLSKKSIKVQSNSKNTIRDKPLVEPVKFRVLKDLVYEFQVKN